MTSKASGAICVGRRKAAPVRVLRPESTHYANRDLAVAEPTFQLRIVPTHDVTRIDDSGVRSRLGYVHRGEFVLNADGSMASPEAF
jgi:hypothetical protein